ncbi:hypothetical protein JHK86_007711 [Glycine max]|nr:hypothetical protein JHK86_007711 [Glycine max]
MTLVNLNGHELQAIVSNFLAQCGEHDFQKLRCRFKYGLGICRLRAETILIPGIFVSNFRFLLPPMRNTVTNTLSDVVNFPQNQIKPHGAMLLSPNSMLPNQRSMPTATHTCFLSSERSSPCNGYCTSTPILTVGAAKLPSPSTSQPRINLESLFDSNDNNNHGFRLIIDGNNYGFRFIIVECYVSNGKPRHTPCRQNLPFHFSPLHVSERSTATPILQ